MLRRLHPEQPEKFAFTPANAKWAKVQIAKYPENRAQSAIIPLLWRAQEQEGWLSRPAIEAVADMLGMAYMRALEVATFYFMFQLQPVGKVAHFQICGTTSCMIMGSDDLIDVCKRRISENPHEISGDGKFSWEEVECLGACTNAPMAQIGKDYYEDLTAESFEKILDSMGEGKMPVPGPQNGRFAAEPKGGALVLEGAQVEKYSASAALAVDNGDAIARITRPGRVENMPEIVELGAERSQADPKAARKVAVKKTIDTAKTTAKKAVRKVTKAVSSAAPKIKVADAEVKKVSDDQAPERLKVARGGKADDLKLIKGVGPKLEKLLNSLGFYHFDQISVWTKDQVEWVDDNLEGFKGRIERDDWQNQAIKLAKGELTEFAKRQK